MRISNFQEFNVRSALRRQRNVIFALMLRNMRTKFFGNGLGYILAIAWPLSHIVIGVVVYTVMGRLAPYGDSIALFFATGILPFQTFSYLARFMMFDLIKSWQLLAFPEVKILDMLFAGALLEVISAFSVVIAFLGVAWLFGIDATPKDVVQASYALGAAVLLGLGFGLINGILSLGIPGWYTAYSLMTILLWFSSGIVFVPEFMPGPLRSLLVYNPVLQVVEWMRSAYYYGYGFSTLDRAYPIYCGCFCICLGLLLERLLRGHLLARRG